MAEGQKLPFKTKHAFELVSSLIEIPKRKKEIPGEISKLEAELKQKPNDKYIQSQIKSLKGELEKIKDFKGEIKFKPNKELKGKVVTLKSLKKMWALNSRKCIG